MNRDEIDDLRAENMELEAEVERLKTHTWQQERAAVVAWMGEMITNYLMVEHSECWPEDMIEEIKKDIERGEHWPEEETL